MPRYSMLAVFILISGVAGLGGCNADRENSVATRTEPPSTADATPTPVSATTTSPVEFLEENWPDGSQRSYKEIIREADGTAINHGRCTLWYDNGNKEYEGTYDHGQLNGLEIAWHRNGQKWTEQQYVHGIRQGYRRNWDPKGRLRGEENYESGRPHGVWTLWKDDGTVKWQCRYEHGKPVAE